MPELDINEFIDRYVKGLKSRFQNNRKQTGCEDVVQETYMQVYENSIDELYKKIPMLEYWGEEILKEKIGNLKITVTFL